MLRRLVLAAVLVLLPASAPGPAAGQTASASAAQQDGEGTRLLRQPTVSDSLIAFAYATASGELDRLTEAS